MGIGREAETRGTRHGRKMLRANEARNLHRCPATVNKIAL